MKNKKLPSIKQSTEVALSRANILRDMTDKILAKQSTDLVVDEGWMERLWKWADDNDIDGDNLPRDREGLLGLTELYLSDYNFDGNQFTKLPKEIGNLVNLEFLYIQFSNLTELPKEIGNLVNLEELHLGSNQLTELPQEIGNLVNLNGLWIGSNQLTELPKSIGNLVNLTWLDSNHNQLTKLPKEIGNLANLKGLLIGNNQLRVLPMEVTNLVLSELNISHNSRYFIQCFYPEQTEWIHQISDVEL